MRAYLDIETSFQNRLTVIGAYRPDNQAFLHLVRPNITAEDLLEFLEGVTTLCTFNGDRFDLPMIAAGLDLDLLEHFSSHDLMYDCWDSDLYGGLKAVERHLGIARSIEGRGDTDPRLLWVQHRNNRDLAALETLLDYNRQDVLNLLLIEHHLTGRAEICAVAVQDYQRI